MVRLLGRGIAVVLLLLPLPPLVRWAGHGVSWTPENVAAVSAVLGLWLLAAVVWGLSILYDQVGRRRAHQP